MANTKQNKSLSVGIEDYKRLTIHAQKTNLITSQTLNSTETVYRYSGDGFSK